MSQLSLKKIKLGDNADLSKNFLISTPAIADGTLTIERENGTDVLTIDASGAVALSGTNTNDAAADGRVGEYQSASRAFANRVAVSTGVAIGVVSISLTAGDWDVSGTIGLSTDATTSVIGLRGKIASSVSAVNVDDAGVAGLIWAAQVLNTPSNGNPLLPIRQTRISLAAATTIYLVAVVNFTVASAAVFGQISARRVR